VKLKLFLIEVISLGAIEYSSHPRNVKKMEETIDVAT
jgi:hypothetical protein